MKWTTAVGRITANGMRTFIRFKLRVNERVLFSQITHISETGTTAFTTCNNKHTSSLKIKVPVSSERLVTVCNPKWRHFRKYGNPSVKSPYDVKRNAWKSQYETSNSMKGIHTERASQGVSCLWTEMHNKLKVDWFIASRERKLINL